MTGLENKVALVTGGAGGIGAAAAKLLFDRGATVVVADLFGETQWVSGGVSRIRLDVSDEAQWVAAVELLLVTHGRLDVLVNAAGIVGDVVNGTLEKATLEDWRRVMAVNLDGTFLGCREAVKAMKRSGGSGSIVNLSSVGSYYPTTQSVAYGASKGAVTQLTKSVALFGSQDGCRIRCNSVHPGRTATGMLDGILAQRASRDASQQTAPQPGSAARIPLGPEAQPAEVAELICFLASSQSSYITGSEYLVDGGWHLLR